MRLCENNHGNFKCNICQKTFSRKAGLQEHIQRHNNERTYYCRGCNRGPDFRSTRNSHERKCSVWQNMSEEQKQQKRKKRGRKKGQKNSLNK